MGVLVQKLRIWWESADRTQKTVTVMGAILLCVMVVGAAFFSSRPRFERIYGGLDPQAYAPIVQELTAAGIPVQHDQHGNVSVPKGRTSEAMMALALANKLPAGGAGQGIEAVGQMNAFTSKAQQDEIIKAATETELARSIQTLDGVAAARVHISLGKDGPFAAESSPPSAVVNVTPKSGAGLSRDAGVAIARLVQHAVAGMRPENVSVISTDGSMLYDGQEFESGAGSATTKLEAQVAESRRRERELQGMLDTVFGIGNTVARVEVELDMDQVEEWTDKTIASETALVRERATEEMTGAGEAAAGGLAGSASNMPNALAPTTPPAGGMGGPGGNYMSEVTAEKFAPNVTRTAVRRAAGTVTAMTVSVLANRNGIEDTQAVEQFVASYLGPRADSEQFQAAVTFTDFDESLQQQEALASAAAAGQARIQQILAVLPILALVVVGLLIVKALGKGSSSPVMMEAALPDGRTMPMGMNSQGEPIDYRLASAGSYPMQALPGGSRALPMQAGDEDDEDDSIKVKGIKSKVDVPLEQIRQMAEKKPEVVAMLLKTWMLEERR